MSNIETVKYIYGRFAHGDAPAILATFDPNIEFRLAEGHPYQPKGAAWIGADAVIQNFFLRGAGEWEGWKITVQNWLELGGAVVAEGRYTGLYKPTARRMDLQVCHVWRFTNGKVTSFHQYLNTARLQYVMGQPQE